MSRDDVALIDIVNAGKRIQRYVVGRDKDSVEADSQARAAVLYEFLVMGEAVKRLSPEFRAGRPDVPWSQIAGMRDVLIHGYDRVNFDRVWLAIERSLPELLDALTPLIPEEPQD
jgi:uncharacterized protein with HEPN domain